MKRDFDPSELVVLRTPLLPVEELEAWSAGLLAPGATDEESLREALAHDRALLRARLKAFLDRPEVREALFLASPDLSESLAQWERDPESKKGQRTELGLVRYFLRMATRPTPFGLFSGCTAGTVAGEHSRLALAERSAYRRHSRLDMDYLFALCEHLAREPELRAEILFRPNTSLYETAGRLRYAEARVSGRLRTYHLVAVDAFDALRSTIDRAAEGARLQDLAEALVADDPDGEITMEDALAFLHELVDSQILVPDLALPVTGEESTPALLRQLAGLACAGEARERLAGAERDLEEIDAAGLGSDPERYRAIARGLEPLGVPVELSRLFQVDMIKPALEVSLGQDVIDEVLRGIELLQRLSPPLPEKPLEEFRTAFRERYGDGREVPLLLALDEESGIGFGRTGGAAAEASPLLEGLPLLPRDDRPTIPWSARETALLRLFSDAIAEGRTEIALTDEDVARLAVAERPPLPNAFALMLTLAVGSAEALEQGDFRVLFGGLAGPSGAKLLGRFCHTDESIHAGVKAHLAVEESHAPEAVFAEVVHLPAGRIGNILSRPVLRSHEIPFLGCSGAPRERQIPVDDLLVTVVGDRIRLRSKKLGREVIPRLTTAHNFYRGSLGVYRFLGAIQGRGEPSWSWGPLEAAPFLPRVSRGRLVLSRARWLVLQAEIKPMAEAAGAARYRLVREWQQRRRMARHVSLMDGDNELLLDFDNPLSIDAVLELIKNRPEVSLVELFPSPGELCVQGPEGRFFHELLVMFTRRPAERPRAIIPAKSEMPAIRRSFPPGSEWLYAKVYAGTATGDRVLREEIAPLAREVLTAGEARSWFFIRYGDPDWHLRVRFHGEPAVLRNAVLPRLEEAFGRLLDSGAARKCQLDTYDREIERYGGDEGIELSEELFFHDSEAVAGMLDSLGADTGADLRWRLMAVGADRMLADFGYDLPGRQRIAETCRTWFAGRYRFEALRGPLADRIRRERAPLERLLAGREEGLEEAGPALAALARRSAALAPIVRELQARERQGRLLTSLDEVVPSYLHMFINRLSRSAGPEHELVIYDFLAQIYSSLQARAKARDRGGARALAATGEG